MKALAIVFSFLSHHQKTLFCTWLLLNISCSHLRSDLISSRPALALTETILADFNYKVQPLNITFEKEEFSFTGDKFSRWSFPSPDDLLGEKTHNIVFDLYLPAPYSPKNLQGSAKGRTALPLLMVMPISGGGYYVSSILARRFAQEGWASIVVHRRKDYRRMERFSDFNPILRQMIIDHRRVLGWALQSPLFDVKRVGCVGVSQGGLKTVFFSAVDKRVKASVIILAGGDLASLMTRSKEAGLVRRRNKFVEINQVKKNELQPRLRKAIRHDPLTMANHLSSHQCMLILAKYDKCVPYINGIMLRRALGNPETLTVKSGHYSAVLALPWMANHTALFLRKRGF